VATQAEKQQFKAVFTDQIGALIDTLHNPRHGITP
jgi:hypothetical protein